MVRSIFDYERVILPVYGFRTYYHVSHWCFGPSQFRHCCLPSSTSSLTSLSMLPITIRHRFLYQRLINGVQNVDGISQAIWGMISWGFGPVESNSEVKNGQIWQDPLPHSALIEHMGPGVSIFFLLELVYGKPLFKLRTRNCIRGFVRPLVRPSVSMSP